MITITLAIVILTAIISFTAFRNQKIQNDLIFYPPAITNYHQWYRFLTCALIHADFIHLLFNMWALYSFGQALEGAFTQLFGSLGPFLYLALYIIAQFLCLLPTYFRHKDDYYYRSLGASGAVSAVVFATILLSPTSEIGIFPIPFGIPGFIFGLLFLGISYYLSNRGSSNINHGAHFWGAVVGIAFMIVFCYVLTPFDPIANFIASVQGYFNN